MFKFLLMKFKKVKFLFYVLLIGLTCIPSLGLAGEFSESLKEKRVLFLCTGNYYRSRLAEALFNFYSQEKKLHWKALSHAINIDALTPTQKASGVSEIVLKGLENLGIPLSFANEVPTPLTQNDLETNPIVVALSRQEHQPVLEKQFPTQKSKIQYWDIGDSKVLESTQTIPMIQTHVQKLIESLEKHKEE